MKENKGHFINLIEGNKREKIQLIEWEKRHTRQILRRKSECNLTDKAMLAIRESDTTVLGRQNSQEKKAVMEMSNLNTICLI